MAIRKTWHLLNNTKNKDIPFPREKLVMMTMNVFLENVYKKVFDDSYQYDTPLSIGWILSRMNKDQLMEILIEEENPR